MKLRPSRMVAMLCMALGLLGAGLTASGIWIHAKAQLAQVLLDHAWEQTLAGELQVKPWPWADTWPVARMQVPAMDLDLVVLAGGAGNALAFGPGHQPDSDRPGSDGHVILGGHRDTHFRFLSQLQRGASIRIQGPDGIWRVYHAARFEIADIRRDRLQLDDGGQRLTLVTCYPFDALQAGGPLRYVVDAFAVRSGSEADPAYTEV